MSKIKGSVHTHVRGTAAFKDIIKSVKDAWGVDAWLRDDAPCRAVMNQRVRMTPAGSDSTEVDFIMKEVISFEGEIQLGFAGTNFGSFPIDSSNPAAFMRKVSEAMSKYALTKSGVMKSITASSAEVIEISRNGKRSLLMLRPGDRLDLVSYPRETESLTMESTQEQLPMQLPATPAAAKEEAPTPQPDGKAVELKDPEERFGSDSPVAMHLAGNTPSLMETVTGSHDAILGPR